LEPGRVRRAGGGRWRLEKADPDLPDALERLVEPLARGDPESPLRWTSKSTRALAAELTAQSHPLSHEKVAGLLREMGYSLQSNRKTEEGSDHPDRNGQFRHINEEVRGGIYDLGRSTGFVNVGTDHDTGAFAVASIRGWWRAEGKRLYPKARRLLITPDGGGSHGYRLRQWKLELQRLADGTGLTISVCHFPPGTSKWNKVEHRLFSFISSNWRGELLRDYETIVRLIATTTTAQGLKVTCRLDRRRYATGKKVSDEEFATLNLVPHTFHGDWNYSIRPRRRSVKVIH
jgi:hypothetical protein